MNEPLLRKIQKLILDEPNAFIMMTWYTGKNSIPKNVHSCNTAACIGGHDGVVITLSDEDFDLLLMMMGYVTGMEKDDDLRKLFVGLVNRVNEGNPDFVPYKI